MSPNYVYRASCVRVVDGDTAVLLIDLGMRIFTQQSIRLRDVDTPERGQPGWSEATAFLRSQIEGVPLILQTYADRQTFNRYVADVWVQGQEQTGQHAIIEGDYGVAVGP